MANSVGYEARIQIQGGIGGIEIVDTVNTTDQGYARHVGGGGINDFVEMDVARIDEVLRRLGWHRIGEPERTHSNSHVQYWRVAVERGRGRPPVGPRITLRFPTDLVARLDERAEQEGTTRSELLRRGAEFVLQQPPQLNRR